MRHLCVIAVRATKVGCRMEVICRFLTALLSEAYPFVAVMRAKATRTRTRRCGQCEYRACDVVGSTDTAARMSDDLSIAVGKVTTLLSPPSEAADVMVHRRA